MTLQPLSPKMPILNVAAQCAMRRWLLADAPNGRVFRAGGREEAAAGVGELTVSRGASHGARVTPPTFNWLDLLQSILDTRNGAFMEEMQERKKAHGSKRSMGRVDCAVLYAVVRAFRPRVCVEPGASTGMASSFILRALADAGVGDGRRYGIEYDTACAIGSMIPEELRAGFTPCPGNVRGFMKDHNGPAETDFFPARLDAPRQASVWGIQTLLGAAPTGRAARVTRCEYECVVHGFRVEDLRA